MENKKLDITQTIKDGVQYGLKNFVPLLLMIILYVVTIWIPYLNVGTTIGLYKAIIGIGRGETIDPTSIFSKENFKNLSGFFLLLGLLVMGISVACLFMLLPGIIMSIAWGFAIFFFLDKHLSPLKSLQVSYDATYGNKWRIFAVQVLCCILIMIVCGILGIIPKVGGVLALIAWLLCAAILVAIDGVMYNFFSEKADAILAEKHRPCPAPATETVETVEVVEEADDGIDDVTTEA